MLAETVVGCRVGVEVDALAAVRVEGAHLGVVARIFGEYVQVLDIDADAQALDDAAACGAAPA